MPCDGVTDADSPLLRVEGWQKGANSTTERRSHSLLLVLPTEG